MTLWLIPNSSSFVLWLLSKNFLYSKFGPILNILTNLGQLSDHKYIHSRWSFTLIATLLGPACSPASQNLTHFRTTLYFLCPLLSLLHLLQVDRGWPSSQHDFLWRCCSQELARICQLSEQTCCGDQSDIPGHTPTWIRRCPCWFHGPGKDQIGISVQAADSASRRKFTVTLCCPPPP